MRQKAESHLKSQSSMHEMALLFAEADACAGEFALAETNLGHKPMMWFGKAARPRSTLIMKLVEAGRITDAEEHYSRMSQPYWKVRAMAAIAAAKSRTEFQSAQESVTWAQQLREPLDRVGAYCGLATAIADRTRN